MLLRRFFVFLLVSVLSIGLLCAQPGDPGGDPDAVPISGLIYLILGGVTLGAYKIRNGFNRK
jgi:hypothetical protein